MKLTRKFIQSEPSIGEQAPPNPHPMTNNNKIKEGAYKIAEKIQQAGFCAYFAGGYVRDMLIGRNSQDIDIVTSATPNDIEKIFSRTHPIGKQYGVILVTLENQTYEVATFRSDLKYSDRRRPDEVKFSNEKEDAKRRDFTINGLFYDPVKKKIIDHVGGEEDIKKKTIRFIGNPEERIKEDNLRLLRAIRLKIVLNFQYDFATFEAVRKNSALIENVSYERIRDEINRILLSPRRHIGLIELSESGLLSHLMPEIENLKGVRQPRNYHREGDVFTHTYLSLKSLESEDASLHLAWAVLLHDIAKPQTLENHNGRIIFHDHAGISAQIARKILKKLKFSNIEINTIAWLIENHMKIGDIEKMRPSKAMNFVLDEKFSDLILLAKADAAGTYPVRLEIIKTMQEQVEKALKWKGERENRSRRQLINGDDLIKLGLEPGAKFKEIIEDVRSETIEGKIKSKQEALNYIQEKYPS